MSSPYRGAGSDELGKWAKNATPRPKLGDVAWMVEWCVELPCFEDGSCDMDGAKFKKQLVKTEVQAFELAKLVYPQDKFGAVQYWPVEFRDDIGEGIRSTFTWEATGDPKEYSGPA